MTLEPVEYRKFERDPIGCFEAYMTDDGWANTKYENTTDRVLFTSEISEFSRFIYSFFKECPDWKTLQKFSKKYGAETDVTTRSITFFGDVLDFAMHISGNSLKLIPYRRLND